MRNLRSTAAALACLLPLTSSALAQSNVNPLIDVETGFLDAIAALGRTGTYPTGETGFAMSTTSCNPGASTAQWEAAMSADHPFISFMITRESGGRMEQISDYSYVKHGFFALSSNQCGYGCSGTDGTTLGIGCSDTYGVGTNGDRFWLGPSTEIDPWLGTWIPTGSLFDGAPVDGNRDYDGSGLPGPEGRVRVFDTDLEVPGASFYYADYYVIAQEAEANRNNNGVWRPVDFTWNGNNWSTNEMGTSSGTEGSVLAAWTGSQMGSDTNGSLNGRVFVASKATPAGSVWHYEYAVHNRDNVGGIGELRLPIAAGATITNFGFHDIDDSAANDWTAAIVGNEIVFDTGSNPVRWNSIYNFWFDADVTPGGSQATLGQFSGPGAPTFTVSGIDVPSGGPIDQCTQSDDSLEDNDTCAAAAPIGSSSEAGLFVSMADTDWYEVILDDGDTATLDILFTDADGDLDLEVYDACAGTLVVESNSTSDNEQVTWTNSTGSPQTYSFNVLVFANALSDCNNYSMVFDTQGVLPPGCGTTQDLFEENDSCAAAVSLTAGTQSNLNVGKEGIEEDWFVVSVGPGQSVTVDMSNLIEDTDLELFTDCSSPPVTNSDNGGTSNESVSRSNNGATATDFFFRVFVWGGSQTDCSTYDLTVTFGVPNPACATDDFLEDNDSCFSAAAISAGLTTGLRAFKANVDIDFFEIDIPAGATITVDALFTHAMGDIDMALLDSCTTTAPLDLSDSATDNESVSGTNSTGGTVSFKIGLAVWPNDPVNDCNDYDLNITIQGGPPSNMVPYCFGDGSGASCPCNNNSSAGHNGGCAHAGGEGAVLAALGNPSVSSDTLHVDLTGASLTSYALLLSADNQRPVVGGCTGCGSPAFDGLSCAGGNMLRHGSRFTNANGNAVGGWGVPAGPTGGLVAAGGFSSGQTRHFFAMFRTGMTAGCMTGQNSSNGISVTMLP